MKKWFVIFFAIIVVTVGVFIVINNNSNEPARYTSTPPSPKVVIDDRGITTVLGPYLTDAIYDKTDAINLVKGQTPTVVSTESEILVKFESEPGTLFLQRLDNEGNVIAEDNLKEKKVFVPSEEGIYVYNLHAWWKPIGTASYAFKIEVANADGNKVQIVATEVLVVTTDQLKRVSLQMTYEEVIGILGNSKDIGSGRYVKKYQHTDGTEFTLSFEQYKELIDGHDFEQIQNLIAPAN